MSVASFSYPSLSPGNLSQDFNKPKWGHIAAFELTHTHTHTFLRHTTEDQNGSSMQSIGSWSFSGTPHMPTRRTRRSRSRRGLGKPHQSCWRRGQ